MTVSVSASCTRSAFGRGDGQVATDAKELAGADENAGIANAIVASRGEQPAAGDDDIALLRGRESGEQAEQENDDAFHGRAPRKRTKRNDAPRPSSCPVRDGSYG